jgi:amino acid adenylation domain-containing protein
MEDFAEPVPQLQDGLIRSATRFARKTALVCGDRRLTYAEIDSASNAFAHALVGNGIARGDRVIVFAENTPEAAISFWAVLKANAIVSVVNPLTKAPKLAYLVRDSGAKAILTERSLLPIVQQAGVGQATMVVVAGLPSGEDFPGLHRWETYGAGFDGASAPARRNIDVDLASIIYTSGSTGDAKGVMLTHRNMITAARSILWYLKNTPEDVIVSALPLAFDYGLYQMIMAFSIGATLVLERNFAFPAQVLNRLVAERATGFPGVPTMFAMLSDLAGMEAYDLSSIRYVSNTAAALPVKHILRLTELFPRAEIYSMYGLTECKRCTYLPPADLRRKPTSVGIAIPNTELWVVDENDRKLGPNEVGQLVIRGATVMKGYWQKPEETAKRLKPGPLPGEQVLYTGDLVKLDEEGYLYFVGRMDDIIKSRGEKVAPKEVEGALVSIAGVKEAAVIGLPDEVLGQRIKAFVVLETGVTLTPQQIKRECQTRLESFMVPQDIVIVLELPRGATGKINKRALS